MNKKIVGSLLYMLIFGQFHVMAQPKEAIMQEVAEQYPSGTQFKKFRAEQQEFKKLSEEHGIKVAPEKMKEVRKNRARRKASQSRFDLIRSTLNSMLKKEILTDDDRKEARKYIQQLRKMGAQFWPGPDDYETLLKLHK